MASDFRSFSPAHLAIMAAIPAVAGALAAVARPSYRARRIAIGLGVLLAINELTWYGFRLRVEGFRFPEGLPLELCALTLWLTVASLVTSKPAVFEFAYLAGIGGAGMAIITPDLWAPFFSYPTIYFFAAHGGVVAGLLFQIWAGLVRPRPGCVWRVFGLANAYAALLAVFNASFGTNYMYLCRKPESASILDFFGPWPIYLLPGEAVALLIFWLLWLPFRRGASAKPGP